MSARPLDAVRDHAGFTDVADVIDQFAEHGYLADERLATTVFLQAHLEKPILLEGPAGVGKTQLAKSLAEVTGRRLLRLQCYEGQDETTALYEWDYGKQLLYTQVLKQTLDDAVYWVELVGRKQRSVRLASAPIEVAPRLRDDLFAKLKTAVLTSATLSVGKQDFRFLRERIGLTKSDELKLGSPFNYREQARLVRTGCSRHHAHRARGCRATELADAWPHLQRAAVQPPERHQHEHRRPVGPGVELPAVNSARRVGDTDCRRRHHVRDVLVEPGVCARRGHRKRTVGV